MKSKRKGRFARRAGSAKARLIKRIIRHLQRQLHPLLAAEEMDVFLPYQLRTLARMENDLVFATWMERTRFMILASRHSPNAPASATAGKEAGNER